MNYEAASHPIYKVKIEKDVPITLPYGVHLFADIHRPDGEELSKGFIIREAFQ
jgi:predicted acyl esterase